jgi:hypothetical protein
MVDRTLTGDSSSKPDFTVVIAAQFSGQCDRIGGRGDAIMASDRATSAGPPRFDAPYLRDRKSAQRSCRSPSRSPEVLRAFEHLQ